MNPEVVKVSIFSAQICVPADYTDEQAREYLSNNVPCGTTNGWIMRKTGNPDLVGDNERVPCKEREDCVHIMFDA